MTYKWNGCCVCVCVRVCVLYGKFAPGYCVARLSFSWTHWTLHFTRAQFICKLHLIYAVIPNHFFPVCYSDRSTEKPIVLNFPMRSIWYGSFRWATRIECRWNAQALAVERTTAVNVSNIGGLVSVSHKWIGPNRNGRLKAVWEERRWTNVHIYTYIKSRNRKWKTQFHQYVIH